MLAARQSESTYPPSAIDNCARTDEKHRSGYLLRGPQKKKRGGQKKKKKALYAPASARDPCPLTVFHFRHTAGVTPTTRSPGVFGLAGNQTAQTAQCTAIVAARPGYAATYLFHTYAHVPKQYAIPTHTCYQPGSQLCMHVWDGHLLREQQEAHTHCVYHTSSYLPLQPSFAPAPQSNQSTCSFPS